MLANPGVIDFTIKQSGLLANGIIRFQALPFFSIFCALLSEELITNRDKGCPSEIYHPWTCWKVKKLLTTVCVVHTAQYATYNRESYMQNSTLSKILTGVALAFKSQQTCACDGVQVEPKTTQ